MLGYWELVIMLYFNSGNISTQLDGASGSLPLSSILRKKSVFALYSMQSPRQIIPLLKPSFYEISNKRGIEQKEWAARYKRTKVLC